MTAREYVLDKTETDKILISVIVPAYNVQEYVGPCLNSVLAQTHENFQLIVIDDGSTDGTGAICDRFAAQDQRIAVIHQENAGLSCARNIGLSHATGEYATFLDGDDMLAPTLLEKLVVATAYLEVPVAVCEYETISPKEKFEGKPVEGYSVVSGKEAARLVVGDGKISMITASGKLYHKDLWPLLHYPEGKVNEDEFVTYRVMYEAHRVALVNARLYGYVKRPGSIMANLGLRNLNALEGLQEATDFFEERGELELASWARKRYAFHIMACYYRIRVSSECSTEILDDLKTLFDVFMDSHGGEVLSHANALLRIQLAVFKRSPEAYVKIASVYLR